MPLKALQSLAGQVNWGRDYGLLGYISATFLPPPQYIHVQSLKVLGRPSLSPRSSPNWEHLVVRLENIFVRHSSSLHVRCDDYSAFGQIVVRSRTLVIQRIECVFL